MKTYREGAPKAPAGAPNILYIVIDDIGFGAIDTFGGLIETPNISRLADNGLRYINFHTTALCSPTRACLLTGRNHHSVGIGTITETATAAIAALLHPHGFTSFAIDKWHDRWPDGPLFGFDGFYGYMAEDLAEKSIELISTHHSLDPDKPWLGYLAFGACHAPHHVEKSRIDEHRGKFDMGWDRYRELVLERQKQMGLVPPHTELAPMLDGVPKWDDLSADRKELFARMMETYAAFMSHTDAQIGRVVSFLERSGQLDNTLIFVFLERIDQLGQSGSDNHCPIGWAQAMNTPFKLCKQYTQVGGTRNPMILHWPKGITAKGELRTQFHHVIDIVPTILQAIGVQPQAPIEGVPMNYSFDDANAATNHPTQYFEMLGNRAIIDRNWKAVTCHGRKPWENKVAWSFDEDQWELYDLESDPSECHDLAAHKDVARADDPVVRKLFQLVGLWWAEAGRYGVSPLDG